jgi:hypothetical protein
MQSVQDRATSANHPAGTPRLDYARRLRDLGLSVFPIPDKSKVPLVAWKPYQDRLPTDDELREWFPPGQPINLGIVTGAISNLVVLDADTRQAADAVRKRLPKTPWTTETARGMHFYYAHTGGHIGNTARDVASHDGPLPIHRRGDHGYVLGHLSRHPSGWIYRSTVAAPRPKLPYYNTSWLPTNPEALYRKPRVTAAVTQPGGQMTTAPDALIFRARRYLAAIPPPVIGQGSDTVTLKAACRLVRGLNLPPSDAEDLLWEWAGGRDGWTREWIAAKVVNALKWGKEPIGGLR